MLSFLGLENEATKRLKNLIQNFLDNPDLDVIANRPALLAGISKEIANGADVNALYPVLDGEPYPLLHLATFIKGDIGEEIASVLIDAGANVNAMRRYQSGILYPVLHIAVIRTRLAMVKKLISRADLKLEMLDVSNRPVPQTALHLAITRAITRAHWEKSQAEWLLCLEIIDILLKSGASLYGQCNDKGTSSILDDMLPVGDYYRATPYKTEVLEDASEYERCKAVIHLIVQKLIELNLLNIRHSRTGHNVGLMFFRNAVLDQDLELMQMISRVDPIFFLPEHDFDQNVSLPLIIFAIKHGAGDVVAALLEDVNLERHLTYARGYIAEILIERPDSEMNLLNVVNFFNYFKEIHGDALPILKFCVDMGLDVNARDPEGNTLLHLAAASGSVSAFHCIRVHFLNDLDVENNSGKTPMALVKNPDEFMAAYKEELAKAEAMKRREAAVFGWKVLRIDLRAMAARRDEEESPADTEASSSASSGSSSIISASGGASCGH